MIGCTKGLTVSLADVLSAAMYEEILKQYKPELHLQA